MASSEDTIQQRNEAASGELRSRLLRITHSPQFKTFRRLRPPLLDRCSPGVFVAESPESALLFAAEAMHDGLFVAWIDGKRVTSKEEFLTLVAQALEFPGYYGRNWDAFDECIRDLAWLPARGHVLVLDEYQWFAQRDPENWNIALAILKEAANTWLRTETPMYVLLRGAKDKGLGVSTLQCVSSVRLPEPTDRQLLAE